MFEQLPLKPIGEELDKPKGYVKLLANEAR